MANKTPALSDCSRAWWEVTLRLQADSEEADLSSALVPDIGPGSAAWETSGR